jgi:hypothetical protein
MVGDAETRGDVNGLANLIAIYEAHQVCVGACFLRVAHQSLLLFRAA